MKAGATAGSTDEFSLRSAGEPIHIRDVHGTILDLMGLDDDKNALLRAFMAIGIGLGSALAGFRLT